MAGGVIRFDAAAHKVADVLLPWFVNGTLKGEELDFVQRHVDECPRCQHEVAWLRELQPRGARRWWPWATAAQFAVIIALGTLLLSGPEAPALYRTLGASNAAAPTTGTLVVVFESATTEAEVRRILRSAGARIVDGPTQANAYVLDVPSGQTERAAQAIRGERAAVLVERLGLQSTR